MSAVVDSQPHMAMFLEQDIEQLECFIDQAQLRLEAPESGADAVCLLGYLRTSHYRLAAMKSALQQLQ